MPPFREENHGALTAFEKHISIAEALLNTIAEISDRLVTYNDTELKRSRGDAWSDLWEKLQQARSITLRLGRDVTAFDAICARLQDPYMVAAQLGPIREEMRSSAIEAIEALRLAVPEVVIPSSLKMAPTAAPGGSGVTARNFSIPRRSVWDSPMVRYRIGVFIVVLIVASIRCATL